MKKEYITGWITGEKQDEAAPDIGIRLFGSPFFAEIKSNLTFSHEELSDLLGFSRDEFGAYGKSFPIMSLGFSSSCSVSSRTGKKITIYVDKVPLETDIVLSYACSSVGDFVSPSPYPTYGRPRNAAAISQIYTQIYGLPKSGEKVCLSVVDRSKDEYRIMPMREYKIPDEICPLCHCLKKGNICAYCHGMSRPGAIIGYRSF